MTFALGLASDLNLEVHLHSILDLKCQILVEAFCHYFDPTLTKTARTVADLKFLSSFSTVELTNYSYCLDPCELFDLLCRLSLLFQSMGKIQEMV